MVAEDKTDGLTKPDMNAVLSRTHISTDLQGFLLPVFEAISNAMHGIDARFQASASIDGVVNISFRNINDPHRIQIEVKDNGVGLDDANYTSFKTPFSGWKLKERGRGFGRFIAFKVFSRIIYASRYRFMTDERSRSFEFDINNEREFIFLDITPALTDSGLCVELSRPIAQWHEVIRKLRREEIANEIGRHFLPYFLYKGLPNIDIQFDDDKPENISVRFKGAFVGYDKGEFLCEIEGTEHAIRYSLARVKKSRQYRSHCMLLSAADRIVGSARDLTNKIGRPSFTDEADQDYVVIAVLRSDAFETRLNDARTGINLASKCIEDMVSSISDIIQQKERAQIDLIKTAQSDDLDGALRENPILRLGLKGRSISEYVASKPNNWTEEEFISDLAIERYRATNDLIKQIVSASDDSENYAENIKRIVDRIDESKKEALAEYVIHRKNIIKLVESARKFQQNGKHAPEDTIHDLIFKRFSDNTEKAYFEHNLWLVDDALAFLPYISSDRTIHGKRRQEGDKVTDILFYDDAIVLGDNDGTTLTIVEFKKPSRNDYAFGNEKTDPVLQVVNTLRKAVRAGGIAKADGTHFSFVGVVRKFAFIIADLTPSLLEVLETHEFKNDWNPRVWVQYRDRAEVMIQVFGYDTLIENAKKRNQAFFSVLLDE